MRPTNTAVLDRDTNFTGESREMTVDASSLRHIMSLLTDLYSDPELAVIREYSTNAWDSHRAAGNDAPIKVTLPSFMSREFVVEDFGVGMSYDDLETIYSKYGASTKRGNDDEVGMLGLGCKSGLTYANQFTLRCRKDGRQTTVVVARQSDGIGSIDYLEVDQPTDMPNGVRFSIAVSDSSSFTNKAKTFFRVWSEGSVLVNGQEPNRDDVTMIDDDVWLVKNSSNAYYNGKRHLVMGNVAYQVTNGIHSWSGVNPAYDVYVRMPIGSFNFTPSREELHYTELTNAAIKRAADKARQSVQRYCEALVSNAKTPVEALESAVEVFELQKRRAHDTYGGGMQWKHRTVPNSWTFEDSHHVVRSPTPYSASRTKRSKSYDLQKSRVSLADARQRPALVVQNYKPERSTPARRGRVSQYMEQQQISGSYLLLRGKFNCEWIEVPVVDWDVVEQKTKPKSTASGKKRSAGETKYELYTWDGKQAQRADKTLDELAGLDLLYFSGAEIEYGWQGRRRSLLDALSSVFALDDTVNVLVVDKVSWSRIQREHDADFTHIGVWLEKQAKSVVSGLTNGQIWAQRQHYRIGALSALPTSELADQDVVDFVKEVRDAKDNGRKKLTAASALARIFGKRQISFDMARDAANPLDNYPLFQYNEASMKHNTEYINAVYAQRSRSDSKGGK